MKTLAAVLVETGKPLVLAELELPALKPGQVLVEIAYSGICHTQVLECRGWRGSDPYLPHCLGHEGSGTVLEIGTNVKKVKAHDQVVMSWIKGAGADVPGVVYPWNGKSVNGGGVTTFGRHAVVSENRLTPVSEKISMQEVALIGCAVPTGVGTVLNTAKAKAGDAIAIFGAGGIGLCAVAGAKISGCLPIIVVDIQNDKLELARQMGASHCINTNETDPVSAIKKICPKGLDFAVEATGKPQVIVQAILSVRNQGGTVVVIGNARFGEKVTFDPRELNMGKRILGTWGGDNVPDKDFPVYCQLVATGKLSLKPLISKTYRLKDINAAINDLEAGKIIRPLIDMKTDSNSW